MSDKMRETATVKGGRDDLYETSVVKWGSRPVLARRPWWNFWGRDRIEYVDTCIRYTARHSESNKDVVEALINLNWTDMGPHALSVYAVNGRDPDLFAEQYVAPDRSNYIATTSA